MCMKQVYFPSHETGAPLSGAYEVNGIMYISGQIHADEAWNLVGTTIEEKFLATMQRIQAILEQAGLTKNDVVRVNIYVTNIQDLPALNEEYKKYFNEVPMPARTAIGVAALPLGASLEIDVIAAR